MEFSGFPPQGTARSSSLGETGTGRFGPSDRGTASLEAENDLKQFLKVVRPDWSCPSRHGGNNIHRVLEKLKSIGVVNTSDLIRRVTANSINEDLSNAGHSRFSRDTLDKIRKQGSFIRSLDHVKEPYYRQVGVFAPVAQMLSSTNLRHKEHRKTDKDEPPPPPRKEAKGGMVRPATSGSEPLVGAHGKNDDMRPSTVGAAVDAVGLGDHGGVFIPSAGGTTTSEHFASLLTDRPPTTSGALYLRNARPRHGRTRSTQSRPVTVHSLPQLSGLQGSSSSTASGTDLHYFGSSIGGNSWAAESETSSPHRNRLVSTHDSESSWAVSHSNSFGDDSDFDATASQHLIQWYKTGSQIKGQPWVAKWGNKGKNAVQRQGEAMLEEQDALDHRRGLLRQIKGEGVDSPMRRHVAGLIRYRLREECELAAQESLDTQQRCINIRKNLGHMQGVRREFSEQKRKVQDVLVGQEIKTAAVWGDSLGVGDRLRKVKCASLDEQEIEEGLAAAATASRIR